MNKRKPSSSPLVSLVKKQLDDAYPELEGLSDAKLACVKELITNTFMITNFWLKVDITQTPKRICIFPLNEKGNPTVVRPKSADVLKKMSVFLGIPSYVIVFADRKELAFWANSGYD